MRKCAAHCRLQLPLVRCTPWIARPQPYKILRPSRTPSSCGHEARYHRSFPRRPLHQGASCEPCYNSQALAKREPPHPQRHLLGPPRLEINASNCHNRVSSPQCASAGSSPQTPKSYKGLRNRATAIPVYAHHTTPIAVAPT